LRLLLHHCNIRSVATKYRAATTGLGWPLRLRGNWKVVERRSSEQPVIHCVLDSCSPPPRHFSVVWIDERPSKN
jgi:hypothetical protein